MNKQFKQGRLIILSGSNYGPDRNQPLDLNKVDIVSVPQGYKARFSFKVEAHFEQAICIYAENGEQVAVKGTHAGRNLSDWETPINNTPVPISYKVTGWHKKTSTGDGKLPWIQSPKKRFLPDDRSSSSIGIGFNDSGNDQDFNDIQAIYLVQK